MHSQREKSFRQNPQVTAGSGRKSADFSPPHRKVAARNSSADETRLARSDCMTMWNFWFTYESADAPRNADMIQETYFRPGSKYLRVAFSERPRQWEKNQGWLHLNSPVTDCHTGPRVDKTTTEREQWCSFTDRTCDLGWIFLLRKKSATFYN